MIKHHIPALAVTESEPGTTADGGDTEATGQTERQQGREIKKKEKKKIPHQQKRRRAETTGSVPREQQQKPQPQERRQENEEQLCEEVRRSTGEQVLRHLLAG